MDVTDAVFGMGGEPDLRCRGDAGLLAATKRFGRLVERIARLHLDEQQERTPPRDDVDFA